MNAAPLKFGSTNQAMNSSFSSYQFGILNWQRDVPGINPIRYSDGQFCGQKIESSIWTFYLQMCMSETPNNCRRRSDQRSNFTSRWGTAAPSPWGWWMSKGSSRPATAHRRALTSSPSPALRISEPIQKCSINSRNQPNYEKVYRPKSRSTSELTRDKVEWQ